jgi:8-oxo-dGTP pyrophosphatase MutT (NUDIX family)
MTTLAGPIDARSSLMISDSPTLPGRTGRRTVPKAVGYVLHRRRLVVFTHDHVSRDITGVQVPAGTIEPGESPADAVVREVHEETGLTARIVSSLGVERYDVWPSKPEVHERHFYQLEPLDQDLPERWSAGEVHPSDGGPIARWTCWWLPVEHAHVLAAGFGARLGRLDLERAGDSGIS